MLSHSFVVRNVIRFSVIIVLISMALPISGALANEGSPVIEIDLIDRREARDGGQVRGSMIVQLRLRKGDQLRPLIGAEVVFKSSTGPKGERHTAASNQQGMVAIGADYSPGDSTRASVQIIEISHPAVPAGAMFDQEFMFHGDPLPGVYVFDQGNARIQKLALDGSYITGWGSEGDGAGQFCSALNIDLAVDSLSNVYVLDGCHRVQKFNSNGDFLMQWGSQGEAPGQFKVPPAGITVDAADQVYVASSGRIQRFSSDGTFQMLISTGSALLGQHDIALDADGDLWINDSNVAHEYSTSGVYLGSRYLGAINDNFVISDAGDFYASSGYRVHRVSADGSTSEFWGPIHGGAGIGEFDMPESFALAGDQLYVLERGNDRVQILTTDGEYVATFGAHGSGNGQFDHPTDIAIYQ